MSSNNMILNTLCYTTRPAPRTNNTNSSSSRSSSTATIQKVFSRKYEKKK
ncbi:hypothetical protein LR48_Vigan468s000600 [Vigna angularis]|uniref:Uncharacterized protein n=2 Tax=Phaseolus angularis TaxID=3914 RepID=A0A0L9TCG2_PHAAN|nr:hypothetical protein LR48_Vigan468s000600 [Vigna angularis]